MAQPKSEREVPRRLADVLRELPYLPHRTAVLGVCRDGVPYLWDLHTVPSLLVLGEGPVLPRQVLDAVRLSLEHTNPTPHFLEILWVTERGVSGGITRAISPHDRGLEKALLGLADLADGRMIGDTVIPVTKQWRERSVPGIAMFITCSANWKRAARCGSSVGGKVAGCRKPRFTRSSLA